ncbi:MAG: hypothetical protein LCH88_10340 [Proteobacteria bacterium]|nr:hypothetical protein [Pseudomonadota bacterium]
MTTTRVSFILSAVALTFLMPQSASAAGCGGYVNVFVSGCAPWDNNPRRMPGTPGYQAPRLSAPVVRPRIVQPQPAPRIVQPTTGNRFISDQGGGLISNNRTGLISNSRGGLISDNGIGVRR